MPWLPIGFSVLGPRSREVPIGRFNGDLTDGSLHLRISYRGSGNPDPLSFFIVDFIGDDGIRSIGSEKWWPKAEPSAVRLGPCPAAVASGTVTIKARSFNRRRMLEGFPSPSAPVFAEVFLSAGTVFPRFAPSGFRSGGVTFFLGGSPVGPAAAYALEVPDA